MLSVVDHNSYPGNPIAIWVCATNTCMFFQPMDQEEKVVGEDDALFFDELEREFVMEGLALDNVEVINSCYCNKPAALVNHRASGTYHIVYD